MLSKVLVLGIIIILLVMLLLLYFYNKNLFEKFVLILMKVVEKMVLSSGKDKFELVADIIISILKSLEKIIPIAINEDNVRITLQNIYDKNKDEINNVISIFAKKSQKKIIKEIEKELCDKENEEAEEEEN